MNIPETLKMPSLSDLGKKPQGILRNQSKRGFSLFFQNNVFKLQKDFSEHGIRVFLEKRLESFQIFLIL
jgi:hypothetical protein